MDRLEELRLVIADLGCLRVRLLERLPEPTLREWRRLQSEAERLIREERRAREDSASQGASRWSRASAPR